VFNNQAKAENKNTVFGDI